MHECLLANCPRMSNELKRLTTEYIESEDRIRLSGEISPENPVVIWLTQRLLYRVVPVLLNWLQTQVDNSPVLTQSTAAAQPGKEGVKDFLHQAAQQSARGSVKPQPPVRAASDSPAWLAIAVDLTPTPTAVRLKLRGAQENEEVVVVMPAHGLRQWLGIMQEATRRGGWPQEIWPEWLQAPIEKQPEGTPVH